MYKNVTARAMYHFGHIDGGIKDKAELAKVKLYFQCYGYVTVSLNKILKS